jgi:hypothetical protein
MLKGSAIKAGLFIYTKIMILLDNQQQKNNLKYLLI